MSILSQFLDALTRSSCIVSAIPNHRLMPKQRNPFLCSQSILFGTTPQLCLAIQVSNQLRLTPSSHNFAFVFERWIEFHFHKSLLNRHFAPLPQHPNCRNPGLERPTTFPAPRRQSFQFFQSLICLTQFQPIFRRFDLEGVVAWQHFVWWSLLDLLNWDGELMVFRHMYWDRLHELVFCCQFHAGNCESEGWTKTVQP